MSAPNLMDAERLRDEIRRWTDFAEQCALKDDRARDGAQHFACGLKHIERGLISLDALTDSAA